MAAVLIGGSCGDDGGSITPPPDGQAVTSVTVSPDSVGIEIADSALFSATLRDADGALLTGPTVDWSSSATAVATVSSSGVATGVGPGAATITASAGGRSGTARVTVRAPGEPGVVAAGTIGAAGGSIGTDDVGLSIAAGQLATDAAIEIRTADAGLEELGDDRVTERYRLTGFPEDREVAVRVRVRVTGELRDQSFVALGVPVVVPSVDSLVEQPGLVLREAVDSSGYLVATVPVRGRGEEAGQGVPGTVARDGVDALLDGLLGGVTGVHTNAVPGGRFVIISWGEPWSELQGKVSRAAKLMEDAWTTLEGQGYSTAHRTIWPIEVQVRHLEDGTLGVFGLLGPWPLDVNTGYFSLDLDAFDRPDMPGTAIHEFYHFIQERYLAGLLPAQYHRYDWVSEASSTWIEEKAPETLGVFRNSFFQAQRSDLFKGLHPGLSAADGYGKAPIMKYVADKHGTARVRGIWERIAGGTGAVDAVLQGIGEEPETWWPQLLTEYMKGEIIALAPGDLPPASGDLPLAPGYTSWGNETSLRTLGARFVPFTPVPAEFGTGTTLTLTLPPGHRTDGWRILPFRMDAAGEWEEQGGVTDSLVIEGGDLRLGRRYGVYLIHTKPTSPYTKSWPLEFFTDMGYADGDWVARDVSVTENAITYSGAGEGDPDDPLIDPAEAVTTALGGLAAGGVWVRTEEDRNHYVWKPTDEFAEELAAGDVTASSEAWVRATGDSLYLNAAIALNPPAEGAAPVDGAALGGFGFLLLLAGLGLRKRRRGFALVAIGGIGLMAWGCSIRIISVHAAFRYELRLANPALTASADDATIPMVRLDGGTGTLFVDDYGVEWWEYIEDEEGVVVDSVARSMTASGHATLELGADLYQDGVVGDDEDDEGIQRAAVRLRDVLRLQRTRSAHEPTGALDRR